MVTRLTVSLSSELAEALDALRDQRKESRSSVVETLLREHPMVERAVRKVRRDD